MEQKYIYVVFSNTPYRIGKLIRQVTHNRFNHVSISLDEEMRQMYSFARRYYRTPLLGGFVQETNSRFYPNGKQADIRLCRIPVTAQQAGDLSEQLSQMHQQREQYLYNHLSALGALVRQPIPVRDAYTCVEFCVEVLHGIGLPVTPGKFYSVDELAGLLDGYCIYSGPMPLPEDIDEEYYDKEPVPYPSLYTLRDMFRLLPRLRK